MLQKVDYAIRVEDVSAGETRASFSAQLLCVANRAQLIFVHTIKVASRPSTRCVEAGQTLALASHTFAGVAALFVSFLTEGNPFHDIVARFNQYFFVDKQSRLFGLRRPSH